MELDSTPVEAKVVSMQMLWIITGVLGIGWLLTLISHEVVARVSGLFCLSAGPHPYFQPSQVGLLYIITPLVVVSSFFLFLSPGGILVLAFGQARSVVEWVILAFGSSLVLTIILGSGVKLVLDLPLTRPFLQYLWLIITALLWLILMFRVRRGAVLTWPVHRRSDERRLIWMLGIVFLGIVAMVPKIFWENFNLDGIEAFEFGRSLTAHLFPHWEIHEGVFGFYQNFMLFAYPNQWFISTFGPFEAAVRLPFLLYLIVLFSVLILLIEHKQKRELSGIEETILWLGLVLYTIVQAYNTTYEPFFADIAEPAATDTLWITCFLMSCYALWTSRWSWFWIFALMTYLASAGGILLLGALAVATFLVSLSNRSKQLRGLGAVLVICSLIGLAHEFLYNPLVLESTKDQFSSINLLKRLYPPTLTEFTRFNVLLFPSGIVPVLSFVAVRRKDPVNRIVALVTIIYFTVIYMQSWTSLHQFTPVMVLPLVVFWRVHLSSHQGVQCWLLPAVAVTTVLSIFLSLPRHFQVNQANREFGQATIYRVGDYETDYEQAVRGGSSLNALLPKDYRLQYPDQPWGTDARIWIYYAFREKLPGTSINYVVQNTSDPPPPGATRVLAQDGILVYVQDLEDWRRDREREIPRVVVSELYEPILRRTYQFFRAYVERQQQDQVGAGVK